MRDDPSVVALVTRAEIGDRSAWNDIVQRYAPLVWTVCRGPGIIAADADDIGGTVWLPIGAIGPTRQRCLTRLRRSPTVAPLAHDRQGETRYDP
jgi:hypothetical protein